MLGLGHNFRNSNDKDGDMSIIVMDNLEAKLVALKAAIGHSQVMIRAYGLEEDFTDHSKLIEGALALKEAQKLIGEILKDETQA